MRYLLIPLIIGLLIAAFFAGQATYKRKLKSDAGLLSEKVLELESLDSLHRAQAVLWEGRALKEIEAREKSNKDFAGQLAKLRKQPTLLVQVPVVKLVECDSSIAAGQSFKRETDFQKMQIIELKELVSIQDTTIEYLSGLVEFAEQRHQDNVSQLNDFKIKLIVEEKRKRRWRAIAISTSLLGLFALLCN